MQLSERDIAVINAVATQYYEVVPHEYKTYCSLTAHITQAVLAHFDIPAKLIPCQVWLVTPDDNYVVGFLGKELPGKWDGHTVCRIGTFIFDAALKHFEKEFGLQVPFVIASPCFDVPTQVISCCDLGPNARLWWYYPPAHENIDLTIPDEPRELVDKYSAALIAHLAKLDSFDPAPCQRQEYRAASNASDG